MQKHCIEQIELPVAKQFTLARESSGCRTTKARFPTNSTRTVPSPTRICVNFAKARLTRIPIHFHVVALLISAFLLTGGQLYAQALPRFVETTSRESHTPHDFGTLPKTPEEIDVAIARIEKRLDEVQLRTSAPKNSERAAPIAFGASADELTERDHLLQQWTIALDEHARYLRSLKEVRRLNLERTNEQERWRGFAQPPTKIAVAEQLTDAVSARRLELRTAEMYLSIVDGEISRHASLLNESQKQLRLAEDDTGSTRDSGRQWLAQTAQLRVQANEASVEAAQMGRLVTWEALEGQRKHLEFLEHKLAAARAQARMTRADLDGVLAQINEKRLALQKDLNDALAADKDLRASRDAAAALPRETPFAVEVENARVETSARKIESLRGFLRLSDYARTVWEDRLWAAGEHSMREMRAKQRYCDQSLAQLREWKILMEQSLSADSEQVLREALRSENTRLSAAERDAAKQIHTTLQERAWIKLRAVGALVFTDDLTTRLHRELSEQIARISIAGRFNAALKEIGALLGRIWRAELYIAEDSVIAGGQKVSIPRSITFGKVVIALTICLVGLLAARFAFRLVNRLAARWSAQRQCASDVPAKMCAAAVALASLLIAMASVRIPWTMFAFLGGALAIGVGFGAQTLINNFISGVILLCERSIRVGDIVEVDDQRGKIVRVGFRNSLVSRGDGIEVLVPNSQFLEKKVVNWTLSNDLVRYSVSVGVAYGSPPAKVAELIAQAAAEHPHVMKNPPSDVLLDDFGDNALVFSLHFWMRLCPGVDGGTVRSELRHRINTLFNEAGINMAFPQRDIHLDSSRPVEIRVVNGSPSRQTEFHPSRTLAHAMYGAASNRSVVEAS